MAGISQFIQSLIDPRHQMQGYIKNEPAPSAGGFLNNAAQGVGSMAGGLAQGVGRAISDVFHPDQIAPDVTNLVKGVGTSVNNVLGQPINPQSGGLQAPSLAEASHQVYSDPVGSGMTAYGLASGVGALKNKIMPPDEAPTSLPAKPGLFEKNDISKAAPSDIAHNALAQDKIQPMQDALNRYGVTDATKAPAALKSIYSDTINPELESNPQVVPLDDVTNGIVQEMKKMQPGLDTREAMSAAHRSIIDLYNVARNSTDPAQVVPNGISTQDLLDLKTGANQTLPVQDFYKNGTIPTRPTDLGTLAASKALTKIVADYHPTIAQATRDYGIIQDAYPSLYKAGQEASTGLLPPIAKQIIPAQFQPKINNMVSNFLPGVSQINKFGGGGATFPLLGGAMEQANNPSNNNQANPEQKVGGNQINQQTDHMADSIAPGATGVNSVPGKYTITTPQGSGFMTGDSYTNQDNALTQQIAQSQSAGDTVTATRLAGQQKQLENSWNQQKPIRDQGILLNKFAGIANLAVPVIEKAPASLLNLNGSYNSLLNSSDADYRNLGVLLQAIEQQSGVKLSTATNKDALLKNLDTAFSIMQNNYNAEAQAFFGGNTLNASAPTQNTAPAPVAIQPTEPSSQVGVPVHYNFDFGSAGQGMPATPPAFPQ